MDSSKWEIIEAGLSTQARTFADWPTFPQIYFNSELVGGGDIIVEMAKMGTLKGEMEKASEKFDAK